jgi:glycosyltransferase involved in cell wall biosynthesis
MTEPENMAALPAVLVIRYTLFAVPPEPGTTRPFHLIKRLAADRPVHLRASLSEPANEWDGFITRPEVASLFATAEVCVRRAKYAAWRDILTLATLRYPGDLSIKDPQGLAAIHAEVEAVIREHGPLVILGSGFSSLQMVPRRFWRSTVVDSVDAVAMLAQRRLATDKRMPRSDRFKMRISAPHLRRAEGKLFRNAAAVTFNSSSDIAYLRRQYPDAPLVRVPDGCDTIYFSPDQFPEIEEGNTDLVFVGDMIYPPNADAAIYLAEVIMPLVWRECPEARAVLIGPRPPEDLRRLHDGERIIVTDRVPDVRPYIKRAAVVASPVRYGAGMKNKLQTGLAMAKAMVVSTVTAEGFDQLEPGKDMLVADDPALFASECCNLLRDPARRRALGNSGMHKIRGFYSWDAAADCLRAALAQCRPLGPRDCT